MKHIGPRPWLVDDVDQWIERLRGPPHKVIQRSIERIMLTPNIHKAPGNTETKFTT